MGEGTLPSPKPAPPSLGFSAETAQHRPLFWGRKRPGKLPALFFYPHNFRTSPMSPSTQRDRPSSSLGAQAWPWFTQAYTALGFS